MMTRFRSACQTDPPRSFLLAFALAWLGDVGHCLCTPAGGNLLSPALILPGAMVRYYSPALAALLMRAS